MEYTTESGPNPNGAPSPQGVSEGAPLDTLAQLEQSPTNPGILLEKRARAKYLSRALAASLARLESDLESYYWNCWHCASVVVQYDGKLTSRYCNTRPCVVCGRIRTAKAINAYVPIMEQWESPHFVTLTLRTVREEELPGRIEMMLVAIGAISDSMRRTYRLRLRALRKLEVTSRPGGRYHPHLHLIVETKEQAELLRSLWLKRHPDLAEEGGQDVKPCDARSLVELCKYTTKLITKTADGKRMIPVAELDVIFRAMEGRRALQPMGFKQPKAVVEEGDKIELVASDAIKRAEETIYWEWIQEMTDWVDRETGECLTGYEPGEGFAAIVEGVEGDSAPIEIAITAEI